MVLRKVFGRRISSFKGVWFFSFSSGIVLFWVVFKMIGVFFRMVLISWYILVFRGLKGRILIVFMNSFLGFMKVIISRWVEGGISIVKLFW